MKKMSNRNNQCDGSVPEGWQMPELGSRVTFHEGRVTIDFRGLDSPTPMVGTLKALAQLPQNSFFEGYYPRRPVHLFPALSEEAYEWEIVEETDDGVLLRVYRPGEKP
jgi:TusA-related sulfurtransferase